MAVSCIRCGWLDSKTGKPSNTPLVTVSPDHRNPCCPIALWLTYQVRGCYISMRMQLNETNRILLSLYISSMIMSIGQGMVIPTIPVLATTFDVSVGLAAQVVTVSIVGRTVARHRH